MCVKKLEDQEKIAYFLLTNVHVYLSLPVPLKWNE